MRLSFFTRPSQFEGSLEIGILDTFRLVFGPCFQPHFFNQAQIEHLGVMRHLGGLVGIRMKVITGEIGAVAAELEALFLDALVNIAWLRPAKKGDGPILMPTSFANRFFKRDAHLFRYFFS